MVMVRASEMARYSAASAATAAVRKAGQRNRVHDGQRPAVVAVEQDERSPDGRSPMPNRIARQVHVGLDSHEGPAIVFDGRQLGVEAPARERETARGRPSTLSRFVST
jgi:hypothetical protein